MLSFMMTQPMQTPEQKEEARMDRVIERHQRREMRKAREEREARRLGTNRMYAQRSAGSDPYASPLLHR